MSHTDKAGDTFPPDQVDVEHVLNDIHSVRQQFTKQQNVGSAAATQELEKKNILPGFSIG
jgi:hypothetical protein